VVADEVYCPPGSLTRRIQSQVSQQQQGVRGGDPSRVGVGVTTPVTIGCLKIEEPGTPALGGNQRPLTGNDLGGLVHKVAHGLPTDRRIGIDQPLDDVHAVFRGWSEFLFRIL
jgi:hypothetical protein